MFPLKILARKELKERSFICPRINRTRLECVYSIHFLYRDVRDVCYKIKWKNTIYSLQYGAVAYERYRDIVWAIKPTHSV